MQTARQFVKDLQKLYISLCQSIESSTLIKELDNTVTPNALDRGISRSTVSTQCIKYARIRVFTDPYSPVYIQENTGQ